MGCDDVDTRQLSAFDDFRGYHLVLKLNNSFTGTIIQEHSKVFNAGVKKATMCESHGEPMAPPFS